MQGQAHPPSQPGHPPPVPNGHLAHLTSPSPALPHFPPGHTHALQPYSDTPQAPRGYSADPAYHSYPPHSPFRVESVRRSTNPVDTYRPSTDLSAQPQLPPQSQAQLRHSHAPTSSLGGTEIRVGSTLRTPADIMKAEMEQRRPFGERILEAINSVKEPLQTQETIIKTLIGDQKNIRDQIHEVQNGIKVVPTKDEIMDEINLQVPGLLDSALQPVLDKLVQGFDALPTTIEKMVDAKLMKRDEARRVERRENAQSATPVSAQSNPLEEPTVELMRYLIAKLEPLEGTSQILGSLRHLPDAVKNVAVSQEAIQALANKLAQDASAPNSFALKSDTMSALHQISVHSESIPKWLERVEGAVERLGKDIADIRALIAASKSTEPSAVLICHSPGQKPLTQGVDSRTPPHSIQPAEQSTLPAFSYPTPFSDPIASRTRSNTRDESSSAISATLRPKRDRPSTAQEEASATDVFGNVIHVAQSDPSKAVTSAVARAITKCNRGEESIHVLSGPGSKRLKTTAGSDPTPSPTPQGPAPPPLQELPRQGLMTRSAARKASGESAALESTSQAFVEVDCRGVEGPSSNLDDKAPSLHPANASKKKKKGSKTNRGASATKGCGAMLAGGMESASMSRDKGNHDQDQIQVASLVVDSASGSRPPACEFTFHSPASPAATSQCNLPRASFASLVVGSSVKSARARSASTLRTGSQSGSLQPYTPNAAGRQPPVDTASCDTVERLTERHGLPKSGTTGSLQPSRARTHSHFTGRTDLLLQNWSDEES